MICSLALARSHAEAGRWAEAVEACRAVLTDSPQNLEVLNILGVALTSSGSYEDGVAVLTAAVEFDPIYPGPLKNLSIALQMLGDFDRAVLRLCQLCALDPADPAPINHMGQIFLEQGDLEAAASLMQRAAYLAVSDVSYWVSASSVMLHLGHVEDAASMFGNALALFSDDSYANTFAATFALRNGDLELAEDFIKKAQIFDPMSHDAAGIASRICSYRGASSAVPPSNEAASGLVLRGPFDTISGYAHMGRRFIQTLREQSVPLNVIGLTGHERWEAEPLHRPVPARALINISIPIAVERVSGLATVTYSMFEGTRIPLPWARLSDKSDLVIVPTESSRMAWSAHGFPETRLRVCPLGVDAEPMARDISPMVLVSDDGCLVSSFRHRFLNVSDLIPRKNLAGLLRVWLRATQRSDDAVLILKTGRGKEKDIKILRDLLTKSEAAVGRRFANAGRVLLVDQMFNEQQMTALFAAATCYWSMSHGEGWDLPMSKAGAMGLSLIAPGHSAYLDYLNPSVARIIPSKVVPAFQPYSDAPYPPFFGLDWWQPDEDAAVAIVEAIVKGRDVALPDASHHLMKNFTWSKAAQRLREILSAEGMIG